MPELETSRGAINYMLVRSRRRRSIAIMIDPERGVVVYAPHRVGEPELAELLRQRADWIRNKLKVLVSRPAPRQYVEGEQFLFLGKPYKFKIIRSLPDDQAYLLGPELIVNMGQATEPKPLIEAWYRAEADKLIKSRVRFYADIIGVAPSKVLIKTQKRRWGSCSSRTGSLNFNWKIVMAPIEIVDYVVVHELAHLKHPNHLNDFWSFVSSVIPNYKACRKWLREQGGKLELFCLSPIF
jgi:predicted metal-dependent hydrolase